MSIPSQEYSPHSSLFIIILSFSRAQLLLTAITITLQWVVTMCQAMFKYFTSINPFKQKSLLLREAFPGLCKSMIPSNPTSTKMNVFLVTTNHQLPISCEDPNYQTNISLIIRLDPYIRLMNQHPRVLLKSYFCFSNKTVNFLKTSTSVSHNFLLYKSGIQFLTAD